MLSFEPGILRLRTSSLWNVACFSATSTLQTCGTYRERVLANDRVERYWSWGRWVPSWDQGAQQLHPVDPGRLEIHDRAAERHEGADGSLPRNASPLGKVSASTPTERSKRIVEHRDN